MNLKETAQVHLGSFKLLLKLIMSIKVLIKDHHRMGNMDTSHCILLRETLEQAR